MLGKDECIDVLASYLNDESLSGPAARALASNGSQKAGQALVAALKSRTGSSKTQKDVIRAITDAGWMGLNLFCWYCRERLIRICRKRYCMP